MAESLNKRIREKYMNCQVISFILFENSKFTWQFWKLWLKILTKFSSLGWVLIQVERSERQVGKTEKSTQLEISRLTLFLPLIRYVTYLLKTLTSSLKGGSDKPIILHKIEYYHTEETTVMLHCWSPHN